MIYKGEILGGTYQVIRQIGQGGSGLVFLAYHRNLQKQVVIKRVQMGLGNLQALRAETDILKNLRHTNIPQVYDFIVRDGEVFTVMDYIDGTSVDKLPAGGGRISEKKLVDMLLQLSVVLAYLHRNRPPVVHSDIKPDNLILTKEGRLCLIDFNIAVTTGVANSLSGYSLHFASPEQYRRIMDIRARSVDITPLDARSDIYSTGAVFYYLMTGCYPDTRQPGTQDRQPGPSGRNELFIGAQPAKVLYQDMRRQGYTDALCRVVARCLEQNRHMRYSDGNSLYHAVRHLRRQDIRFRRYLALRAGSWLLSAVLIGGGCWYLVRGNRQGVLDSYEADYHAFTSAYNQGDEEAEAFGREILNSSAYEKIRRDRPEDTIKILQCLGDLAMEKEDFENAQEYYADALKTAQEAHCDNARMYRDYAVALVRNGYITMARDVMQETGADDPDSGYVHAYIDFQNGDSESCIRRVEELLSSGADPGLCAEACVLAADACEKKNPASGEKSEQERISWLEKAVQYSGDAKFQRILGAEYWKQVGDTRLTKQQWDAYAEKAMKCYEKVSSLPGSRTDDLISRVIAMQYLGYYDRTITLLKPMVDSGTKDYRIPAYLAIAYDAINVPSAASRYASAALDLAEQETGAGVDNELTERLRAIASF